MHDLTPKDVFTQSLEGFSPDWPEPDMRYLRPYEIEPPKLDLSALLSPKWVSWLTAAAEAKSAPADYVLAALLTTAGSLIGNTRWVSPWAGWAEPPILWAMAIGTPSLNKSPGLDAVLTPLKKAEEGLRAEAQAQIEEWRAKAEIAKIIESTWKDAVKAAVKDGKEPPKRPNDANNGREPLLPRLALADATIEKLAVIAAAQPRGAFLARDELTGWLQGMSRYSSGGSDRPFWLEAYGGRSYSVERMGCEPVYIPHLSVGVLGGIQPDRLRTLLLKSDDDGLLARFMPFWPHPVPLKRPQAIPADTFFKSALARLIQLQMPIDAEGQFHPWHIPFTERAKERLDSVRREARELETDTEGLLLSFIGKLPGLAVRLSLVLAMLDWASEESEEPIEIEKAHFDRAANFALQYLLPMARRAYAENSLTPQERSARRLAYLLQTEGLERFHVRDIQRRGQSGLSRIDELNAAIKLLTEAELIRPVSQESVSQGGRPQRLYITNPALWLHHADR